MNTKNGTIRELATDDFLRGELIRNWDVEFLKHVEPKIGSTTSRSNGSPLSLKQKALKKIKRKKTPSQENDLLTTAKELIDDDPRDVLMAKIRDLAMANAEILENIENQKSEEVIIKYNHSVNITLSGSNDDTYDDPCQITTNIKKEPLQYRLDEWKYSGEPIVLHKSFFNRGAIDLTIEKYDDVIRLNRELHEIADNFYMIALDNELVRDILRCFLNNFKLLLVAIGEISELTIDVENVSHDGEEFSSYFKSGLNQLVGSFSGANITVNASFVAEKTVSDEAKKSREEDKQNSLMKIPAVKPDMQSNETLPFFNRLKDIDCKMELDKHEHAVWTIAMLSSDKGRKYLATDGNRTDHTISVWDMETKALIGHFAGHPSAIYGFVTVKFHNGKQMLVSGGDDKTIKLWDVNTKKNAGSIDVAYKVRSLCSFSLEDGTACIAIGFREVNKIQLWNLESTEKMGVLEGHSGPVYCLSLYANSDGCACLASGSDDGKIKLWDLSTFSLISTLDTYLRSRISALATYVDSEGRLGLASGNNNGRVELWDLDKRSHLGTLDGGTGYYIYSFALFSGNNNVCLAYGGEGGTIKIWDVKNQELLIVLGSASDDYIENLLVASDTDGRACIISCDRSSTVKIWEEFLPESWQMRSEHRQDFLTPSQHSRGDRDFGRQDIGAREVAKHVFDYFCS